MARRRFLATSALFVASVALCLAGGEAFLRWYEPRLNPRHTADPMPIYEENPTGRGSVRMKPGLDVKTRVGRQPVRIVINKHGMRWRELPLAKPEGTERVAFFGDSFTFGCWADSVENGFVGVFERLVSRRFEALNFGTPGFGIDDSELLLREKGLLFDPDYVVLAVFNGNDFRDTFLGVDRFQIGDGTAGLDENRLEARVPAEFIKPDHVRATPVRPRSKALRVLRRSALYRFVAPFLGWKSYALEFHPSRRFTSYSFWSGVPYPEVATRAVEASLGAVGRMAEVARAHGLRLGIIAIPTREQVYSDRLAGPDFDVSFPQIHLQLFARQNGIAYLDLLPALRDYVARDNADLYMTPDPHFNTLGHRVAGEAIADWFRCCLKNQPAEAASP